MSSTATQNKHVVVYGGSGGLGLRVVDAFAAAKWRVTSVDFRPVAAATDSIVLDPAQTSLEATGAHVKSALSAITKTANSVDAIVNVAGGWAGGNLLDDDLYKNVSLMIGQSVNSAVITAKLSATELKAGGLLVLVGASAATSGTPGMIAYGIAKAGVHHLVSSVAAPGSGFPEGAKVTAILPVTLDTPMNRKFMPDADFSKWTPLEDISGKILSWAEGQESLASGTLFRVVTEDSKTSYVPL